MKERIESIAVFNAVETSSRIVMQISKFVKKKIMIIIKKMNKCRMRNSIKTLDGMTLVEKLSDTLHEYPWL